MTKPYRYPDLLINIFVVVLIVVNLILPKVRGRGMVPLQCEVYGYSASRKAIRTGFMASVIMTAFGLFAVWLPPAPEFKDQQACETIFGVVPRNVAASLLA